MASQRINYDWLFGVSSSGASTVISSMLDNESMNAIRQGALDSVDRKERRGPAPTPVEWAIAIWVSSHTVVANILALTYRFF